MVATDRTRIVTASDADEEVRAAVRAVATLIEVDGRKLSFRMEAFDQVEKIAEAGGM